ncbi:hypothetical protein UY3_04758 [Chelonia mydas]|uniref:Uncharacterized protein n=1 Tax=Chelonia mydas TaxID=8469 RepID=M7BLA4_CHEMY|nr:hypothetical protein UY3_04758 [Chelonia mydas]
MLRCNSRGVHTAKPLSTQKLRSCSAVKIPPRQEVYSFLHWGYSAAVPEQTLWSITALRLASRRCLTSPVLTSLVIGLNSTALPSEKGHDWDTLQFRVKVKQLRNANQKVREANHCSGAAPTSCRFYKELDAILGGNPTSTAKTTVDTSVACVPVETGLSQEEEILDEDVEGEEDPEAEADLEVRNACSQEFFSTPEEASQSQQSDLDEA